MKMLEKNSIRRILTLIIVTNMVICGTAFGGRLIAWGANGNQLLEVPEGDDFVAVSASWKHAVALRSDGSIACWGQNNWGQSDPPEGNDFVDVSAGQLHNVAIRSDGSLFAWGYNVDGQCDVPGGNDFTAIAAGHNHSLALRADGSVVAWGTNEEGETNVAFVRDGIAIAAGDKYSVVIRSPGRLLTRGQCSFLSSCHKPQGEDFVAVAVDGSLENHGLALRSDGTMEAWGAGEYAQPADGNDFIAIAAGNKHSLAIRQDNTVLAWGDNEYGQCDVPEIAGKFVAIAGAIQISVAIVESPVTENVLPVADPGEEIVAHANEEVILDASGSYDPDGTIVTYTWRRLPDDVVLYSGPDPTCTTRTLGRAEEVIELTVCDDSDGLSSETVTIVNARFSALN